jgi:hypothetical protein
MTMTCTTPDGGTEVAKKKARAKSSRQQESGSKEQLEPAAELVRKMFRQADRKLADKLQEEKSADKSS